MSVRMIGCLGVALGLAACGGAPAVPVQTAPVAVAAPRPAGPVEARGGEEVRARVGRAGGSLELSNGGRLEIPPGALTEDTEIVFRHGAPARNIWDDADNERAMGPMLEAEPPLVAAEGTQFRISTPSLAVPAPFRPRDLALGVERETEHGRAMAMSGTETRWDFWPGRIEGQRFVADMAELPGHRMQFGLSR